MPERQTTHASGGNPPSKRLIRHGSFRLTLAPLVLGVCIALSWLYMYTYYKSTTIEQMAIPIQRLGGRYNTYMLISQVDKVDKPTRTATAPSTTNQTTMDTPSLANPTSAKHSFFFIKDPKDSYKLCDVLELYIEVRDKANLRKKMGGDVMWPYICTVKLKASAPADEFIDHGSGNYTARFTLTWAGLVEPVVRLAYSAEHSKALRNIRKRVPNRFAYNGKFIANGTTEVTPCHISKVIPFIGTGNEVTSSNTSERETCDFSDVKAGTHWYCLKPKTLPCQAYTQHIGDTKRASKYSRQIVTAKEKTLFKSPGPGALSNNGSVKSVRVVPRAPGNVTSSCLKLPQCTPGLSPKQPRLAAGYYYQDSWESRVCQARAIQLPDILTCLRGKNVYFFGDSTIRQWFEYLVTNLGPTMKEARVKSSSAQKVGPRHGADPTNNITLFYRHHEYPIRNSWTDTQDIKFTVNEVDSLPGGPNTVVAFTYWAHFTPTNLAYYKTRLENVKAAVKRLHQRGSSPSPVIFKSANTRRHSMGDVANLYAYDLDQVMRALFIGTPNVTIVDAWDMTLSHWTGYRIHPVSQVIREEIKMFLNIVCKTN